METFGSFHDGCVREVHLWTGHYVASDLWMAVDPWVCARMLVQRQYRNPSAIELLFVEVGEFRLSSPPPDYEAIIFEADLTLDDGLFRWEDGKYYPDRDDPATSVTSKRLFWREASELMGNALRYRPNDMSLPLDSTDLEGDFPVR